MTEDATPEPRELNLLSIVVAMYDEEPIVDVFFERIDRAVKDLGCRVEYVIVNDGSRDRTLALLLERMRRDARLRIIDLTRNFGKEAAMTVGLEHARGDAVVLIDADLQDPPELIGEFVARWREGYDNVYGARISRRLDSVLKRATAWGFYAIFNRISNVRIPRDAGDFRLLDRRAVDALLALPERNRFMKGLFAWVGFRQIGVPFERQRRVGGTTSWNYWKLWNFAVDGMTSFSDAPLRLAGLVGSAISGFGLLYALYLVIRTMVYGIDVPGYASLMVAILFLGGVQLLCLGVLGEYIGRLYIEAKGRPLYLVSHVYEQNPAESGKAAPAILRLSGE